MRCFISLYLQPPMQSCGTVGKAVCAASFLTLQEKRQLESLMKLTPSRIFTLRLFCDYNKINIHVTFLLIARVRFVSYIAVDAWPPPQVRGPLKAGPGATVPLAVP